jgi:putative ABC transport system permease protein
MAGRSDALRPARKRRAAAPLRRAVARAAESIRADCRLAARNVLRQRRRSFVGILSVAFGVVALLLAAGFIEWIYWAMREDTIRTGLGHVQIARAGYFEAGQADPFAFLLPAESPERAGLERRPGVRTVSPRLSFSGLASRGETTISFLGEGMDPAREGELAAAVIMHEGEGLSPSHPREIVMGRGLAANLGAKVGDTVVLLANTRSGGINAVEVRVRGLFSTVSKAYDDAALRVPLATAEELLRVRGAHRWVVLLASTAASAETAARIRAELDPQRFDVVPWRQLADFYNKTVDLFSKQVFVMKLIIALIIVLSITNTQMMSVLERTGEIGTSMALGVTRARVLRRFLLESLAIGLIGAAAGLLAGMALAKLISAVGIPMPPPPGAPRALVGEIRVTWSLALDALSLALVTTLVAGAYPAWKASRMVVVDALRHAR